MGKAKLLGATRVIVLLLAAVVAIVVITELIGRQWNAAIQGAIVGLLCWLFAQRLNQARLRALAKSAGQGTAGS